MPGLIAPAADPALPALEVALDGRRMARLLAEVAGVDGGPWSAEVIAYKPGQRCTIRYACGATQLVGKVYGRPVLAERVAGWIRAAGEPGPLAIVPELGLLIRPYVAGRDLRHALDGPAVALAARRLAELHATAPPAGVKPKPLARELDKLDAWCDEIDIAVPGPAVRAARRRLHALAETLSPAPAVLIHRDFYYANVIWDGDRVWLLDFDELGVGDASFDVGHFLAHLEVLGYRTAGRFDAYGEAAGRFQRSYGACDAGRLSLYRGYTLLKLAVTEVRRRRPRWREQCDAFVTRACTDGDAKT